MPLARQLLHALVKYLIQQLRDSLSVQLTSASYSPGVTANTLKTKNPQKIAGTGLSCRQARRLASTRSSLHTSQTVYQPSSRPRRRLTSSTHAPFIDAYCRCLFSLSVHHLQCQPPCLLQLASLPLRLSQRVYDRQDSFFMLITWVTQLFTISCPYALNIIVK